VALMGGRPQLAAPEGVAVRPLEEADLASAERLHRRIHGFERTAELRDALAHLDPTVAVRDGRVVGYATTLSAFAVAHAVAETDVDMLALIAAAPPPVSFLLPTRQSTLFRAALAAGLRVVKPMNYMTLGPYRRPAGAWIPTVLS
jgi:hypothetical protein